MNMQFSYTGQTPIICMHIYGGNSRPLYHYY